MKERLKLKSIYKQVSKRSDRIITLYESSDSLSDSIVHHTIADVSFHTERCDHKSRINQANCIRARIGKKSCVKISI